MNNLQISYGDVKYLTEMETKGKKVNIKRIIQHPEYNQPNPFVNENDIALIELEKPIKFTDHVKPACLGVNKFLEYQNPIYIAGLYRNQ